MRIPFYHEKISLPGIISLAGVLLLFLLLRWNSFTTPFERDEGEYAYGAQLLHKNMMPYEHSFLQKPPVIIYIYWIGQVIADDSIVLPRIFASVSILLTIFLAGSILANRRNTITGLGVMWLLVPMLSFPPLFPFAANTEVFMILPMMGVFYLYMRHNANATRTHWLLAGCYSSLAILIKPIVLTVIGTMIFFWLLEAWQKHKQVPLLMKNAGYFFGGVVVTGVLSLLPFLLHDGGATLKECVFDYNLLYSSLDDFGIGSFTGLVPVFWKHWWIIILLLSWFLIKRPAQWWIYLCLFLVSLLTIYRMPSGHYYIMAVPFLGMIAGLAIDSLFPQTLTKGKLKTSTEKRGIAFGLVLLLLLLPNYELISKSPDELSVAVYSKQNPFIEARIIAEKIKELTQPTDKIFIAGSEPEILYYADRQSISRFIIIYPLMIPTEKAVPYQNEVIQAVESTAPELIVYVQSPTSWLAHKKSPLIFPPYIDALVKSNYTVTGGTLFDLKQWVDSPSEKELRRCSMVIYKKKG